MGIGHWELGIGHIGKTIGLEMMPISIGEREYLIRSLKDPIETTMYIEVTIEESGPQMLRPILYEAARNNAVRALALSLVVAVEAQEYADWASTSSARTVHLHTEMV
ncbi:MAG: hypothetical protein F6J93_31615 [Oscillatoria sp. SIO1A7]|nr:hypothetical protein [Oscillatoria sp. SIO1A7]